MSYIIYSPAFDALPDVSRDHVYRRMKTILGGEDETGRFAHLTASDRTAILEILRETKPEFALAARQ